MDDIGRLREIGVTTLLFNFQRQDLARTLAAMQRFADQVRPLADACGRRR